MCPREGMLLSNDEIFVKFYYTGKLDHPREFKIKFRLQRIKEMKQLVGILYSHTFTVCTDCQYQRLCVRIHFSISILLCFIKKTFSCSHCLNSFPSNYFFSLRLPTTILGKLSWEHFWRLNFTFLILERALSAS